MPKIPEPEWLNLSEARHRTLTFFGDAAEPAAVEQAIVQAFYEGKIKTEGKCRKWFGHDVRIQLGNYVWDPDQVRVCWDLDCFVRVSSGYGYVFAEVYVHRRGLESWLAPAIAERVKPPAARSASEQDGLVLKWPREKWRREWIACFAERQRIARRWIALVDLVDWCAQSTTTASLEAETKARDVAYRRLTDSVRKGEFERDGRSKLLYLDTIVTADGASPRCRLTREQFEIAYDAPATPPARSLPLTVLNCCWLPIDMAKRWLKSHGYRWAPHFEPGPISAGGRASSKALRVKPRPPSREKKFWLEARDAAFEWLIENGCPEPGDGNQAELERYVTKWLEGHGHEAGEATVRRHVVRWVDERRAELNA